MIDTRGVMNLIPMLRFAMTMMAGIVIGDALEGLILPTEWLLAALATCLLALWGMQKHTLSSILIFLTILYLGAFSITFSKQDGITYTSSERHCEGVIISEPVIHGKVYQCDVLLTKGWDGAPAKLRASIMRDISNGQDITDTSPRIGTTLEWTSTIEPPHDFAGITSTNFSYERWLRIHDFKGMVFMAKDKWRTKNIDTSCLTITDKARLQFLIWRSTLLRQFTDAGVTEQALAIVAAMSMGEKSHLSKSTKALFSSAGASHLLALSGMHIGIIAFLLSVLTRGRRIILSQSIVLLAIWLFVFFVGMPTSALRSATMMTIWFFLNTFRRGQHPLNVLGTSALLMIVINPEIVFDAGFEMSYMAVFFILLCMPYLIEHRPFKPVIRKRKQRPTRWQRTWLHIWSFLCISVVAQLGTASLAVYYFGTLPLYFIITNIIAIPLATSLIICSLLLSGAILSGFGVKIMVAAINFLSTVMLTTLQHISALPCSNISGISINALQLTLIYIVIFCIIALFPIFTFRIPEAQK